MVNELVLAAKLIMEKAAKSEIVKKLSKEAIKSVSEKIVSEELKDDPDYQDFKSISDTVKGIKDIGEKIKNLEAKETAPVDEEKKESESDNKESGEEKKDKSENESADSAEKPNSESGETKSNEQAEHNTKEASEEKRVEKTTEEKVALQEKEIQKVESGEKTLDSTQEKGNYGEMKMDQDLRSKGYERISKDMVTDTDSPGHQGIDGVYYNPDGNPKYIIADAKYGTAQLSETQDGKQMSDNWIDKRLDESVGKEKADDIRMEALINPDGVGKYVAHVDSDGNVTYDKLDSNANVVEKDVKINA